MALPVLFKADLKLVPSFFNIWWNHAFVEHVITDSLSFQNILDKFNPGARQLISAGKAYLKALHGKKEYEFKKSSRLLQITI